MPRKVTLDDIAKKSRASVTTVSMVLRDKPGIGPETRHRVLAAAQELGYRRRGPATRRDEAVAARNVGLVLRSRNRAPEPAVPGVNPFYWWVLAGIEAEARPRGINLLYATLPVDDENRPLDQPRHLLGQPLDGLLLIGSFAVETVADLIGPRSLPVVLVDAPAAAHPYDAVASDNEGGAHTAVSRLIALGHRRIALVGPQTRADPNLGQRRDGYLRALREHGLAPCAVEVDASAPTGDAAAATAELLRRHPGVTALLGANDAHAIDALRAAQTLGRRVPGDLAVVGFDDIELATQTVPPLATMAVDKVSMGRLAVRTLLYRLAWPDAARSLTLLRAQLLERGSIGGGIGCAGEGAGGP